MKYFIIVERLLLLSLIFFIEKHILTHISKSVKFYFRKYSTNTKLFQ